MSELEVIFSGPNYEANVMAAVLEANDIPVEVLEDTAYGNLMGAHLLVPADLVVRAREVLAEGLKTDPSGNYN